MKRKKKKNRKFHEYVYRSNFKILASYFNLANYGFTKLHNVPIYSFINFTFKFLFLVILWAVISLYDINTHSIICFSCFFLLQSGQPPLYLMIFMKPYLYSDVSLQVKVTNIKITNNSWNMYSTNLFFSQIIWFLFYFLKEACNLFGNLCIFMLYKIIATFFKREQNFLK